MVDQLESKMDNLQFGFDAPQQTQDPGLGQTDQNDFGFGNSNWDSTANPPNADSQFNATNVAPQEQQDVQDAFGFGEPSQPAAPAQDAFGLGQPADAEQPVEDAFGFDEPPKGDQVTNIGEDAEELALIEAAQRSMQERLSQLRHKEEEELAQKRALKQKAQDELNEWYRQKNAGGEAKRKQNKEEEWAFLQTREEHKKSKNPWEKIIDNVEIDQRKYLGAKDVTRMRQAMLARKQDLKKAS